VAAAAVRNSANPASDHSRAQGGCFGADAATIERQGSSSKLRPRHADLVTCSPPRQNVAVAQTAGAGKGRGHAQGCGMRVEPFIFREVERLQQRWLSWPPKASSPFGLSATGLGCAARLASGTREKLRSGTPGIKGGFVRRCWSSSGQARLPGLRKCGSKVRPRRRERSRSTVRSTVNTTRVRQAVSA